MQLRLEERRPSPRPLPESPPPFPLHSLVDRQRLKGSGCRSEMVDRSIACWVCGTGGKDPLPN
jgi:hypothetical protein